MTKLEVTPNPLLFHTEDIGYLFNTQAVFGNQGKKQASMKGEGLAEWDRLIFGTKYDCDFKTDTDLFLI